MKLTTGILLLGMATGAAWAQNPDVIQDTRSTLQNIQKKQVNDQNAALAAAGQTTSSAAKPKAATPASAPAVKPAATAAKSAPAAAKPVAAKAKPEAKNHKPTVVTVSDFNPAKAPKKSKKKTTAIAVKAPKAEPPKPAAAATEDQKPVEPKKEEVPTYAANGRRDPFVSPVVNRSMLGSGCSTGKRCLAIDQINLQGVVKSESGMIAVVVNALNKAYFLHENDPVFNGYVVKITGDSIIFKETVQDKLGKPFEREVTKKISTPAV